MKVVIELSLEEAIEYLRVVGSTSVAQREAFLKEFVGELKRFRSSIGSEDVIGVVYDKIQRWFEKEFGASLEVEEGVQMGDIVIVGKDLVKDGKKVVVARRMEYDV